MSLIGSFDYQVQSFKSVEDALLFAYRCKYEQYQQSLLNRMASSPTRTGNGLGGIDGIAQAGMIQAAVEQCGKLHSSIIAARYAPRYSDCDCGRTCCSRKKKNPFWVNAVVWVANECRSVVTGTMSYMQLRQGIVGKYFGDNIRMGELADLCHLHPNTVRDHKTKIVAWLTEEEGKAFSAATDYLQSRALIQI